MRGGRGGAEIGTLLKSGGQGGAHARRIARGRDMAWGRQAAAGGARSRRGAARGGGMAARAAGGAGGGWRSSAAGEVGEEGCGGVGLGDEGAKGEPPATTSASSNVDVECS